MPRRSLLSSAIAALLVAGLCAAPALGAPPIDTLAGSAGEGPATTVAQTPTGLAVRDGRLFVADETFAVVRVLDPATGAQTVVAGNASKGREGDGGPATAAQLGGSSSGIGPQGIALTPEGDLLIADTGSNRVRRVDAESGEMSTVAGTGTFGSAVDGGQATESDLGAPFGVAALPGGGFVVADTSNHRIRGSRPTARSPPLPGRASASRATAARRTRHAWRPPAGWQWRATGTCSSPTPPTTACAAWMPRTARSPPWRAGARPTRPAAARPQGRG